MRYAFNALTAAFAVVVFGGLVFFLELGRRIGVAKLGRDPDAAHASTAAVDGTVYALLGLLVAFTFSGAADRYDGRRRMIGEEAGAIRTAYMHIDLFQPQAQPALRQAFRDYVDVRLAVQRATDLDTRREALARFATLRHRIWNETVLALALPEAPNEEVVIPSLDVMFQHASTRIFSQYLHTPPVIFGLLVVLSFVASVLAGYQLAGSKQRSVLHLTVYAATFAAALALIVELDFPRLGLTDIDRADIVLVELRAAMH